MEGLARPDLRHAGSRTDRRSARSGSRHLSPAIGVLLYAVAGLLGWFLHPAFAVVIFVFIVCYYAATNRGVCTGRC
jgi:hypothetical protein